MSTNVLSNLQGNAAEVRTNIETALVQGSSIIGDGTDGETFGGFVEAKSNSFGHQKMYAKVEAFTNFRHAGVANGTNIF